MCTSPEVITLPPLLCRTPACIRAYLNRASLNVHVSALCTISLKLPISQPPPAVPAHTPVGKFTIWTSTNIRFGHKPAFKSPSFGVSLGVPNHPVWPLSISLIDQGVAHTTRRKLHATFSHNIKSIFRSKDPFLFV